LDLVYVNGLPLTRGGQQVRLTGANETWSVVSYDVPISMLKFPQSKGNGAAPTVGRNEIAIQIDANQCNYNGNPAWAVEVDYGIFEITGPVRPVVFVHGWTGNTSSFSRIEDRLRDDGIPSAGHADLREGIYPISQTAGWLNEHIRFAVMEYGVDKVNLFAHSKGGLVSRWSLNDGFTATMVEHVVTFDSPHHGTEWADNEWLMRKICDWNKYPNDPLKADLCFEATKEFATKSVRETFNYSGCTHNFFTGWSNCQPKYIRQPGVDYRAFAARGGAVVIPIASTTYPWNADRVPMPLFLNVDAGYFDSHGGILERADAYRCSMHLLDDSRYGCPGLEVDPDLQGVGPNSVLIERTAKQVVMTQAGSLAGSGQFSVDTPVDGGTQLVMELYANRTVSFSLVEPGGRVITPAVASADPLIDYTNNLDSGINYYSYLIANPAPGVWRVQVQSGEATDFTIVALVDSPVTLELATNKTSYLPGELVTVQAALVQSSSALRGSIVTGDYEQPNGSSTSLAFYDDGTNGDPTANDGMYTARFIAPQTQANLHINVQAYRVAIRRESSTLFSFSPQTAIIQGVSRSWTEDEDQNGLIDWLKIEVTVDVLQAGHFDLQGRLVDGTGVPVHSDQFVSRNNQPGPLLPGRHAMVLAFQGPAFWASGRNGPYYLTGASLSDTTGQTVQVDSRNNLYTTAAYNVNQFEHPVVRLESMTETATDQNGNNLFDQLTFSVRLAFSRTGNYVFNGRLVDPNGDEIAWSGATFNVPSSGVYAVNVSFPGAQIGAHRVDGPYFLRDVSVYNQQGTAMVYLEEIGATRPYRFTQFENGFYITSLPLLTRNFSGGGSAYNWIDATAGGAIVAQGDDTHQYVGLPFAFNFYGNPYTGLYVSSNGFVSFGSGSSSFSNGCIPSTSAPNNAIYAFWDDLVPGGGSDGNVYVKQVGSDTFVIEWHGVRKYGTSNSYHTFEIVLRRDHTITLQYQSLSTTHSATVGVENGSGTLARQHICDGVGTPLSNQLAIRFATP
jgi:pimeloyl-ACP methyl ester carboxylesterase